MIIEENLEYFLKLYEIYRKYGVFILVFLSFLIQKKTKLKNKNLVLKRKFYTKKYKIF